MKTWKPLDAIFILLSSATLVLFIFWASAQMMGSESFEELPSWMTAIASEFWTFLVSGTAAAFTQWLNSNRSSGPNYILWIIGCTVTFLLMIYGTVTFIFPKEDKKMNIAREMALLTLELPYDDQLPVAFIQTAPTYRPPRNYAKQTNGYYEVEIDLPKTENTFNSKIAPVVKNSALTGRSIGNELCFIRTSRCQSPHAIHYDFKRSGAGIDNQKTKCSIQSCSALGLHDPKSPVSFASFYQQQPFWVVPSLENLKKYNSKGYSLFSIAMKDFGDLAAEQVEFYTYEVVVNDRKVLFNGFQPEDLRYSLDEDSIIEFGLQSLNFNGEYAVAPFIGGYEKILVKLNLYEGNSELLESFLIPLDYVAFRNFRERDQTVEGGLVVTWKVDFTSAEYKEYEVFIASSVDGEALLELKKSIDRKNFHYNDQRVRAVIRPPLNDSPFYGIIVGLEKDTKQIDVTFRYTEAKTLLAWVKHPDHVGHFRKDAYLYNVAKQFQ